MMRIIEAIKQGYQRSIVQAGRARIRRELLSLSDRSLVDAGFSRELLEAGVSAWPWRVNQDIGPINYPALAGFHQPVSVAPQKSQYRQAVAELRAYSDLELADLGLARGQIEYAVKHGRPGIDNVDGDYKRAA
jgi:uncharacterized protein YjiS (DUF1127 family)